MFIREIKTTNRKTSKIYIKHVLVESIRTEAGPRQRRIMQLGQLDIPKKHWPLLAEELQRRLSGDQTTAQLSFIPDNKTKKQQELEQSLIRIADGAIVQYHAHKSLSQEKAPSSTKRAHSSKEPSSGQGVFLKTIDCNTLTSTSSRSLGAELVGYHAWQQLQLPTILKQCGLTTRQTALAAAVVIGRLIRPASDFSTWNWIRDHSSISELTGYSVSRISKDAVYEIADELLNHKSALEQHLFQREQQLFPDRQSLYLFDLTNFHMEGVCAGNELAAFGKSKQKRNDLRLISLALMVDSEGFPVTSRVYEGNIGEPVTLSQVLTDMGYLEPSGQLELLPDKPILVMDRGIATTGNLALIKQNQFQYIVVERAPRHKEYTADFRDYQDTFERIERTEDKDVWVKKVITDDSKVCRVLCLSEGKQSKEQAIADRWVNRAITDLEKLRTSIAKGSIKNLDKVYQRLGKIKGRYAGFGKRFTAEITVDSDQRFATDLNWQELDAVSAEDDRLFGCYVIETDQIDLASRQIWQLYMTLTRVEAAFHSLKTDLGTRPVYH
ncbi:MAG: IS1634 family transposase, partial [Desulfobulbaceae bacterium]|nr:IS1634 family transposase [Desulfobulbaceae bacterium]